VSAADHPQNNRDIGIFDRPFCEARTAWAFCTSGKAVGVCSWPCGRSRWIRRERYRTLTVTDYCRGWCGDKGDYSGGYSKRLFGSRHKPPQDLVTSSLRPILRRVRQRPLVILDPWQIAGIEIATAEYAFPEVPGFTQARTPTCRPMTVPRGNGSLIPAISSDPLKKIRPRFPEARSHTARGVHPTAAISADTVTTAAAVKRRFNSNSGACI
jgi:hypothetical protein